MLSLWKLRVGGEHYYLSQVAKGLDDYYTGRGEMPGRWLGAAASGFGLGVGEVSVDELRAVLAGLAPRTGLTPNGERLKTWQGRVPGFDLTFSAPKSVSVLYGLGDPLVAGQVIEATDAAVDAALAWLEREACFVRRGSNNRTGRNLDGAGFGTRRLPGAGFVAAGFRHRTSRAGDPQVHTHVLVANMTRGPDGRWSALDAQGLYRSKRTAGVVYQTVLREELTRRLGVSWGPVRNDSAEIAGIPAGVLRLFSKRRQEIEAALAANGGEGPAASAVATLATRRAHEDIDAESLRDRWRDEAATVGFSGDDIDRLLADQAPIPAVIETVTLADVDTETGVVGAREIRSAVFVDAITDAMIGRDSTCTRHQVTEAVASLLPAGATVGALQRITTWVLAQPQLVAMPTRAIDATGQQTGWEQRWTSRRLLTIETDLLNAFICADKRAQLDPALVDQTIADAQTLGPDQADAVRQVATQGRAVEVIVGRAGTGKTYTMNVVRGVFEAAGYTIVGAAPSARAARELADGAGFETWTFPRFMRHSAPTLTDRHVVVIDEAGMAGTIDLHHVLTAATLAGAKVILVGDHRQLPEVAAGGGFAAAVAVAGNAAAELTVNRRQTDIWEHGALDHLRHGRVLTAFDSYQEHGRVVLAATSDGVHRAAVSAWITSHLGGRNAILLAGTRAEARALNLQARAHLAAELSGPVMELRGHLFQAGDRIVLLHNAGGQHDLDRGIECRVDNGMIANITRIDTETDTIDIELLNGRRIRLDRNYVLDGHLDHGYATTIHKAQGITCDQVFVVGPTGLYREAVYVAMSRARDGAWIYATSRQAGELAERSHTTGIPLPSEHADELDHDLKTAISASRAKTFAITQAPQLPAITDLAAATTLDVLWDRHVHIRATTRQLLAAGHTNPADDVARLQRAHVCREFLRSGGRVNAADWDNIGTVVAIFDRTGSALVEFTSSDGKRTATKTLEWADMRPIDNPEPIQLTDQAAAYFALAEATAAETLAQWNTQLAAHGIGPDEATLIPAAIEMRRQQVAHALAGDPPEWLTWWLGERPADHCGAQIFDDELAQLAAWRDARHLNNSNPGYGPQPDNPNHADRWREHLDRSLQTRTWLAHHNPKLAPQPVAPVDITAVRERLDQLAGILASAPPDQTLIIDAITNGTLSPTDIHQALADAANTQAARRDWIVEHWPYVIEHAELTRIHLDHDALAHWPEPTSPAADALFRQLLATTADTPEPRTLTDLDAELDATNPHRQLAKLVAASQQASEQVRQLSTDRATATSQQAAIIDQHLARLNETRDALARRYRDYDTALHLWSIGSRPQPLTDAIARRTNHLGHTALAINQPWINNAIHQWTQHHSPDNIDNLRRTIHDIAAHRERTQHTGADPLGPAPDGTEQLAAWQYLDRLLHTSPSRQITDLLHQ